MDFKFRGWFRPLVHRLIALSLRFLQVIALRLSWNTASKFGTLLGAATYYLLGKNRRRMVDNIHNALGSKLSADEQYDLAYCCCKNMGRYMFQALKFPTLSRQELFRLVDTAPVRKAVDESRSRGKNILLLAAHYSNWEFYPFVMAQLIKVTVTSRKNSNPWIEEIIETNRKKLGFEVINRDDQDAGKKLRGLSSPLGNGIGILIDIDTRQRGVFSPFLGVPANTPTGPVVLAMEQLFDTYVTTLQETKNGTYIFQISSPLEFVDTGDFRHDIQTNTDTINALLSEQILTDPSQWAWMHRRWRTKPLISPADLR